MNFYMHQPLKSLLIGNLVVGSYLVQYVEIRETTAKGKVKEYVYQKQHAAENKISKLMKSGNEFVVCTEDQLHFISPKTDEPDYD